MLMKKHRPRVAVSCSFTKEAKNQMVMTNLLLNVGLFKRKTDNKRQINISTD